MNPEDVIHDLAERVAERTFKRGTVNAVTGTTLTVTVEGRQLTNIRRLSSYSSPAVNDVVEVACAPGRWFVLGKLA